MHRSSIGKSALLPRIRRTLTSTRLFEPRRSLQRSPNNSAADPRSSRGSAATFRTLSVGSTQVRRAWALSLNLQVRRRARGHHRLRTCARRKRMWVGVRRIAQRMSPADSRLRSALAPINVTVPEPARAVRGALEVTRIERIHAERVVASRARGIGVRALCLRSVVPDAERKRCLPVAGLDLRHRLSGIASGLRQTRPPWGGAIGISIP